MTVYGDVNSGNCYKVKWILERLQIEYQWQEVDILAGETQTQDFLAINPAGKIPVVTLADGRCLSESNAILGYFAQGSELLPEDRYQCAQVYQWLFFEQYSHEPYIAVARFIQTYLGMPESRQAEYTQLQSGGHKALSLMEAQLSRTSYLVGERCTIADIALYAYTHVADQGGFDLNLYPSIQRWCAQMTKQPNYVAMGSAPISACEV
ncbi:glutathione S-transferase family protein [Vibrio sp. SM6]|uniref:Glutathione S-transferase family protein n=1 Tax=Vibrio agarilyticus TaxID=2726741 RepID=A0A7X8YH31_9VIBR|nr:glutathione S-transferase family protein [Vibrio agarilyticus]